MAQHPLMTRNVVSRKMATWVGQYEPTDLFWSWTKVHQTFSVNVEGVLAHQVFFQTFDMSICSGDIRDQSRKLTEIAPKFGRSFGPPNFFWGAFQKLYARYYPCVAARRLEKFRGDTPTSPEVIEAHTLNFRPNF